MKIRTLVLALACISALAVSRGARAQDEDVDATIEASAPVATPQLVFVDVKNLDALQTLGAARAVSLNASRAALAKNAVSLNALKAWVKDGGTVFLHTDAAQIFGYRTTAPRAGSNRLAGQFWGRAQAVLPFGAHPLLQGAVARTPRGNAAISAVRTIYYQMSPGDALVLEHPAAVPLLRVTDLATRPRQALFAAAIAPFGRGWAIFTPSFVEPNRGDGAVFVFNLMKWAGVPTANVDKREETQTTPRAASPINVPASILERIANAARRDDFDASANGLLLLQATNAAPDEEPGDATKAEETPESKAGLPLTQVELTATIAALSNAGDKGNARAALFIMRARLALQRGESRDANAWFQLAAGAVPDAAEVALWSGLVAAQASEDHTLASPIRARLLAQAVVSWQNSLGAAPMLKVRPLSDVPEAETLSGIPRPLIAAWITSATVAARLFAVEPPLVTLVGDADNGIVIRHFANDPSLRLAVPIAAQLVASSNALGARADDEEVLFFPTPEYYSAYRQAAGLSVQNSPAPAGFYGDVVDGRMLLLSQFTQFVMLPPTRNRPARPVAFNTALAPIMGRLHAGVLIQQIVGNAQRARVPSWMQMGLAAYAGLGVQAGLEGPQNLNFQPNGVLTPADYRAISGGATPNTLADFQALRLMTFFYARFGAGNVIETLQRLGAGENLDNALGATARASESQFFTAWLRAENGG